MGLQTWANLECFSRRAYKGARNIIDCRWVVGWKREVSATSMANASQHSGDRGATKKVMRARLTTRGFKERGARHLDGDAGTSQRYSQRLACSEAAHRGWPFCNTDVCEAFLQGVIDGDSELTGEPVREVSSHLPGNSAPLLKQGPRFETFSEHAEALHCGKPGAGLAVAPRALSN